MTSYRWHSGFNDAARDMVRAQPGNVTWHVYRHCRPPTYIHGATGRHNATRRGPDLSAYWRHPNAHNSLHEPPAAKGQDPRLYKDNAELKPVAPTLESHAHEDPKGAMARQLAPSTCCV